jgi:hypothetical protein
VTIPKRVVRDPAFEPLRRAQERDETASEAMDDFKNTLRVIIHSRRPDAVRQLLAFEIFLFIAVSPSRKNKPIAAILTS